MTRIRPALLWRTLCVLVVALPSTVPASDSVAVFHEIHYHPADGGSEWSELRNQLAVDLDIRAWSLADGVRYNFPEGTVFPAGGVAAYLNGAALVRANLPDGAGHSDAALAPRRAPPEYQRSAHRLGQCGQAGHRHAPPQQAGSRRAVRQRRIWKGWIPSDVGCG